MNLYNIAAAVTDHLVGRLLRRALFALLCAGFAIVALYHFTVAGTLALEFYYGSVNAQLIVGAIYTVCALIALTIMWTMGRKAATPREPALAAPREMQVAMLVEAVMLGYSMGKKRERAS
jgi:lysylphosphatidylglycerol synthetase-like protein (DUF2156 family)